MGRLNPESAYAKFFPDQLPVDGTHMPTLREVVRYVNNATQGRMGFQIEMKTDPSHPEYSPDPKVFAQALYQILKEEGIIGRAEIQAFDWRCLFALRQLDDDVKTAYLTSRENEKGGEDSFYDADPSSRGSGPEASSSRTTAAPSRGWSRLWTASLGSLRTPN